MLQITYTYSACCSLFFIYFKLPFKCLFLVLRFIKYISPKNATYTPVRLICFFPSLLCIFGRCDLYSGATYTPENTIEEHADTLVNDIIHQYDGAGYQDRLLDDLQRHGACCGLTSPSDWLQNSFIQTLNASATHVLPCSCFSSHQSTSPFPSPWCTRVDVLRDFGLGNHTHTQGCRGKLGDWLQENTVTVVAMDVTLMLTQVLQLALAASLYLAFGQKTTDGMAAIDPAHHNLEPS
ncbi:tetraspanin-17-like isoform X2 [Nerophis ophidion]|uniref:tetraspanin-17-like isoform X2 n=1 Tax=Nerophis ophidion TaxID=159077 RepID=UPI002ADF84AB|nr:tetraspanin-17-like isoform X2 [Nerophis ophidion]